MKLLVILFLLAYNFSLAQPLRSILNQQASVVTAGGDQRWLVDFGGNGTADNAVTDNGIKTPNNSAGATGSDGTKIWNNVVDARAGTWISNPVDISGNVISGLSIQADKSPGDASFNDFSINFAGPTVAVGDYPATAVRDNAYFFSGTGVVNLTISVPAGKRLNIKFWGSRSATGTGIRVLEMKKSTDATYTLFSDTQNNSDYNNAISFSNLTGTVIINARVRTASTYGHVSVIDGTISDL